MKNIFSHKNSVLLMALLVGVISSSMVLSQPPPPRDGQGGPDGPGGFRGPGGQGGMRGGGRLSPAHIPASALKAELKLSVDQAGRIKSIQDNLKKQRDEMMPRPGDGNDGPPDMEEMRAKFDKMRASEQKANKDVEAILSDEQREALPKVIKSFGALREAGIPLEVYSDLKLTSDQKSKIEVIVAKNRPPQGQRPEDGRQGGRQRPDDGQRPGPPQGGFGRGQDGPGGRGMDQNRQKIREAVNTLLTDTQKKTIKAFMDKNPRPEFGRGHGGPGGPGGRGGFGGDGPPPPPPSVR